MGVIFIVHPQQLNGRFVEIEKDFVRKTVYFVVILLSDLFMQLQDGKDQLRTLAFMKMHGNMTCIFQLASIILPTLVFQCATNFWFLIETYVIILRNGVAQVSGGSFFTLFQSAVALKLYRPHNKEELFNLRHASARNVVERIFGVLKRRFHILHIAPEYNMNIQAKIPTALCAIHNFICEHDPQEGVLPETRSVFDGDDSDSGPQAPMAAMTEDANTEAGIGRDRIAQEMWEDYLDVLHDRGIDIMDPLDDDDFDDDNGNL